MGGSLNISWHCPSLGLDWKLTISSPVATAEFSKFEAYCSTLTASSFRILNSSTGIPSPPLTLFVVMFPKPLSVFTLQDDWLLLSGHTILVIWDPFYVVFSVYSCHLLLFCSSIRSLPFLSFTMPIFAWNIPLISPLFLERSCLSNSITFFYSFAFVIEEDLIIISPDILWNSAFSWVYFSFSPMPFTSLLSSAICKASSDSHFAFLHIFFPWDGFSHCFLYSARNLCP